MSDVGSSQGSLNASNSELSQEGGSGEEEHSYEEEGIWLISSNAGLPGQGDAEDRFLLNDSGDGNGDSAPNEENSSQSEQQAAKPALVFKRRAVRRRKKDAAVISEGIEFAQRESSEAVSRRRSLIQAKFVSPDRKKRIGIQKSPQKRQPPSKSIDSEQSEDEAKPKNGKKTALHPKAEMQVKKRIAKRKKKIPEKLEAAHPRKKARHFEGEEDDEGYTQNGSPAARKGRSSTVKRKFSTSDDDSSTSSSERTTPRKKATSTAREVRKIALRKAATKTLKDEDEEEREEEEEEENADEPEQVTEVEKKRPIRVAKRKRSITSTPTKAKNNLIPAAKVRKKLIENQGRKKKMKISDEDEEEREEEEEEEEEVEEKKGATKRSKDFAIESREDLAGTGYKLIYFIRCHSLDDNLDDATTRIYSCGFHPLEGKHKKHSKRLSPLLAHSPTHPLSP